MSSYNFDAVEQSKAFHPITNPSASRLQLDIYFFDIVISFFKSFAISIPGKFP